MLLKMLSSMLLHSVSQTQETLRLGAMQVLNSWCFSGLIFVSLVTQKSGNSVKGQNIHKCATLSFAEP